MDYKTKILSYLIQKLLRNLSQSTPEHLFHLAESIPLEDQLISKYFKI